MSHFEKSVAFLADNEGGFTIDHAGPTNRGILLRELERLELDLDGDGDIDRDDVEAITPETAREYYRREWWERYGYHCLTSEMIAAKTLDLAVVMGPLPAHKALQRACRAVGRHIKEDGILGPITAYTANTAPAGALLAALCSEAAGRFRLIAYRRPDLREYLEGWEARAYRHPEDA